MEKKKTETTFMDFLTFIFRKPYLLVFIVLCFAQIWSGGSIFYPYFLGFAIMISGMIWVFERYTGETSGNVGDQEK